MFKTQHHREREETWKERSAIDYVASSSRYFTPLPFSEASFSQRLKIIPGARSSFPLVFYVPIVAINFQRFTKCAARFAHTSVECIVKYKLFSVAVARYHARRSISVSGYRAKFVKFEASRFAARVHAR